MTVIVGVKVQAVWENTELTCFTI